MRRLLKIGLGMCIVALCAAAGIWGTQVLLAEDDGGGGQSSDRGPTLVGVASPQRRSIEDDVSGVGTLRAIRTVALTSAASGRVTEVGPVSGAEVSRGDLVLRLDDRAERADLAEAEATLAETRSDFQRFEELGDSNATSEARVEEARGAYRRAEAAVSAARAALEDRTLRAPFEGTLGLLDVEPGTYVTPETTITTLFDLSEVELRVSIPERYFDRVTPGQTVTMSTPAYPDKTFEGRLDVRAPEIDLATRSFDIRAHIDNPDRRLVGGMFADARLVLDSYESLAIPDDAIISEGLTTFVYVVADGMARRTEIRPGQSVDDLTEVENGLEAEDQVVVTGWDTLTDGASVEIDETITGEALN